MAWVVTFFVLSVAVCVVFLGAASGRKILERREARRQLRAWPRCGHSACRQNWIETGEGGCVR